MRFTAITSLPLLSASLVGATSNMPTPTRTTATESLTTLPASTDASAYLSEIYSPFGGVPTQVTGALATTLASSLFSLEKSWETNSMASSNNAAIWSAAAKDTRASEVLHSLDKSGYNYGQVITNDWYSKYVPDDVKSEVAGYNGAWESVFMEAIITGIEESGTASSTATATATPTSEVRTAAAAGLMARCTGLAVAAAAGALGAVVAAI
ncbi:hypothetical protein V8F20_009245 [Naviculisporaceae sp. PSN 640]